MKKRQYKSNLKPDSTTESEKASFYNFVHWLTETTVPVDSARSADQADTFEEPSNEALQRYSAVPLLSNVPLSAVAMSGEIAYDSWAHGPAPALRDITQGHIRRVRMQAGKTTLEIVAERTENQWEFVARAYVGDDVIHDSVLRIGRKKLLAQSGGFFHWTSKSVPRIVELMSYTRRAVFEELAW